jgi:hypothetical protein
LGRRVDIPLAVVMERKEISRGRWSVPSWQAIAVVAGKHIVGRDASASQLPSEADRRRFLWSGIPLTLFRDKAECYRHNLIGEQPALYVVCQQTASDELRPMAVTADPYEASGHVEGDDQVFQVGVPPEVYRQIEAFIVQHNTPEEKRKRKRKQWTEAGKR